MATKSSPMAALRLATTITEDTTVRFAALMGSVVTTPTEAVQICKELGMARTYKDLLVCTQVWPASRVLQATPMEMLELIESQRFLHSTGNKKGCSKA